MRQLGIWLCLSAKRLGKRPLYWVILLLMPLITLALSRAQEEPAAGIRALVCVSGAGEKGAGEENEAKEGAAMGADADKSLAAIIRRLEEADGVVRFETVPDEETLQKAILGKKADFGYVFPADFGARLRAGEWKRSVRLYCGNDEALPMLVNELVYTAVFREYSEHAFREYAGTVFADGAGGRDTAEKKAEELLELYLSNGSTFSFRYYGDSGQPGGKGVIDGEPAREEDGGLSMNLVPVRGMLALFIMLGAFCGLIDYKRDQEAGRLVWLHRRAGIQWIMVMLPAAGAAAAALLCLGAAGQLEGLGREIACSVLYVLLLTAYVMAWGRVFRSEHGVVASMPFLLIATVLFCPIFWNLKAVLPIFAVMEKLFPVSWYLAM